MCLPNVFVYCVQVRFYFSLPLIFTLLPLALVIVSRSRDYQIFSDGQFTTFSYPWCSAGALHAPELCHKGNWETVVTF